jgi:hypothetical protein
MPKPSVVDEAEFRSRFEPLLNALPSEIMKDYAFFDIPCDRPPWFDTGLHLEPGDRTTTFARGRTCLDGTDLWFGPDFQIWRRIGENGQISRGTRAGNSFEAESAGRLFFASYFPGEWATQTGELATPPEDYQTVTGDFTILVIRWRVDQLAGLRAMAAYGDVNGFIADEIERLTRPVTPPKNWSYLWFLGPAEVYRSIERDGRAGAICCRTHRDVGLLIRDAPLAFEPDTRLRWSWKVDELPSKQGEDRLETHDYLSIAVEFDNGQDITYLWSSELPVGQSFRCPIPSWTARETHVVIRSGPQGLGEWRDEERDVFADYAAAIGGPAPARITRVWLIAVSLFQGNEGKCQYSDIAFVTRNGIVTVT